MKFVYMAIAVLFVAGPIAYAQGSGSADENVASGDTYQVTRSFEGKITRIKLEDRMVVVQASEGERHSFHLSDDTEITSSKDETDSELLKVTALKPGDRVKIIFTPSDMYVTKLRILNSR